MTIDLSTTYLGIKLESPFVASACPLTGKLDSLKALERAGASAAVLPSLFEEQIEHEQQQLDRLHQFQTDSTAESLDYFPKLDTYNTGPDQYLQWIHDAKQAVSIPIIASLNGSSDGGWVHYSHLMEQAGADALELNIYTVPTNSSESAADIERGYCDLVASVRTKVTIPLAIKIGPYFSALPNLTKNLVHAGADGLVLFNRYLAPDIDLEKLSFDPTLQLSTSEDLRVAIRWIAILRDQFKGSIAATGGIHSGLDAAKVLLVGADALLIASALLSRGTAHLTQIRKELVQWMTDHEYRSIEQLKGSMSLQNCPNPQELWRANYMKALTSFTSQ